MKGTDMEEGIEPLRTQASQAVSESLISEVDIAVKIQQDLVEIGIRATVTQMVSGEYLGKVSPWIHSSIGSSASALP